MKRKTVLVCLLLGFLVMLCACQKKGETERSYENAQDVSFEIVSGSDVPYKDNEKIFKLKEEGFGFSYRDGDVMYTAFGFGQQNTGGYSIQVLAVKETESAIIIEAQLIAPEAEEVIVNQPSTPYMILKMANAEKDVQFLLH